VYDRIVDGKTLTLQVSGMLWKRSLVMRDLETGSLWSHILGACMEGELQGKTLAIVPAHITTWADWKSAFPDTTVLDMSRTSKAFTDQVFQDPERFVYGVRLRGKVKAWSYRLLLTQAVIQQHVGGEDLLLVTDTVSGRVTSFSSTMDEVALRFLPDLRKGVLVDTSGSTWHPLSGEGLSGEHKGRLLKPVVGIISFRKAWKAFYPDSSYAD
jgi:hypothetical protein